MKGNYRVLSIGKTRLVRRGSLQTWLKAEVQIDIDSKPTVEDIEEVVSDIDDILQLEENTEHARWDEIKNQQRK